jgi:hypothetical protein
MVSPAGFRRSGLFVAFSKRTRKPNSVLCGHSSRRRVAADAHQRPTRRFRHLLEPPCHAGPAWDASLALGPRTSSLFGLAPCGVYPASVITAGAVRSYRTFSPLPLRGAAFWTGPAAGRYVFCGTGRPRALKPASRTLSGTLPCGVRTFLPRVLRAFTQNSRQRPPGPPASVSLPRNVSLPIFPSSAMI